jgi:anti-sigma factor RsiW
MTMSSRPSDWEALNAYVDGELEPADAADVADRIAREPAFARRAAALTGMKAALAETADTPAFDFDPPDRKAGYQWRWLSVAAAVIVIFAAFALWTAQFERTTPAWLTAAAAAHTNLAALQPDSPPKAEAVSALRDFEPYLPDLSAAKLSLAAAAPFAADGHPNGVILQYTGTRGCRVTYVAFPGEGLALEESLTRFDTGGLTGYGWRVGAIGYALLAQGMDPNRLEVIAASVHAASRLHRPFDEATRSQLAQSRANSRACSA